MGRNGKISRSPPPAPLSFVGATSRARAPTPVPRSIARADSFPRRAKLSTAQGGAGFKHPESGRVVDALAIITGKSTDEEVRYLKSISMEIWLFAYELPETVIVMRIDTLELGQLRLLSTVHNVLFRVLMMVISFFS